MANEKPNVSVSTATVYHSELADLERSSLSWRAVFAGGFISLLIYLILTTLGLAIGGTTLQDAIQGGGVARGFPIGSGIWLIVSALVSLFVGAFLAARTAGIQPGRIGGVQGLVISALFFAILFSQIGMTLGAIGSGIGSTIGAAGGAIGDVAENPKVQSMIGRSLQGLNLQSPPDVVIQGIASRLIQGDETGAVNFLAVQAGITPTEARQRIDTFRQEFQQTLMEIGSQAAQVTAILGWILFGSLTLGSAAALFGGVLGARRTLRHPVSYRDENLLRRKSAA